VRTTGLLRVARAAVVLPVTAAHAWRVRELPAIHNDPFDRLLAAQAICERASIVSADTIFDSYGVTRVW
jgi:PIN domain nuclease of toxin-antitoxin system